MATEWLLSNCSIGFLQGGEFALTACCKSKAGSNIFLGKVRKFIKEFLLTHSASDIFKNVSNSHPCATDAQLSATFARFNGNNSLVIDLIHNL